jgi:hypothetical protein
MSDSSRSLRSPVHLVRPVNHAQVALVAIVREVLDEAVRGGTDLPEGLVERVSAAVGHRTRKVLLALACEAFDAGVGSEDPASA